MKWIDLNLIWINFVNKDMIFLWICEKKNNINGRKKRKKENRILHQPCSPSTKQITEFPKPSSLLYSSIQRKKKKKKQASVVFTHQWSYHSLKVSLSISLHLQLLLLFIVFFIGFLVCLFIDFCVIEFSKSELIN
jgi:hypothetical protein